MLIIRSLTVLPLALLQNYILYGYQRRLFHSFNLKNTKKPACVLLYQMMMSPVSVLGCLQERLKLGRVWK